MSKRFAVSVILYCGVALLVIGAAMNTAWITICGVAAMAIAAFVARWT